MHKHGASCLEGPITLERAWWPRSEEGETDVALLDHPGDPTEAPGSGPSGVPESDPAFRRDLVDRIRREIAEGHYETPERMEAALDRFLERLDQD